MIFSNKKRKYFQKKLVGVEAMLWDRDFKIYKLRELREDIRREYDRNREIADSLGMQLKREDLKDETKKILEEKQKATLEDVKKMETQMTALDNEVGGEGGIKAEVEGLHELRKMIVHYMKERA
jgi:hypothetical protein